MFGLGFTKAAQLKFLIFRKFSESIIINIIIIFCMVGGLYFWRCYYDFVRVVNVTTTIYILVTIIHIFLVYIEWHETYYNRKQTVIMHFVLITIAYLLLSGPFNRLFMSEIYQATDGSDRMNSYFLTLFYFKRCVFNIVTLFLIGYILEKGK